MTHQQILDKLAAGNVVSCIDDELARLVGWSMNGELETAEQQLADFLPKLLSRWNCVLKAGKEEIGAYYKEKVILVLAVLLHKYGFKDKTITEQALKAIDKLNKGVVLSDHFFRKTEEIKAVLNSDPVPLKKRPGHRESITFYRSKDVISFQLDGQFYAAYIHGLVGQNNYPIIEFYDQVFTRVPELKDLKNVKARGAVYNDGVARISLDAIYLMKYLPDLANQVHLIAAGVEEKPSNDHLEESVGLYGMSDIFRIQDTIRGIFKPR
ncbi:hypothetical protein HDE69_001140 [Pedobacter cryoconitis]|uniref:Uncharacterized protein n=1 Tax=Pedobacter cryoconitis TaxID=188932 RepID=A0A7W8YR20_9SPHI|nr:hypothetical protein [Pedobacter cryoconitis]MBB5620102.1 hypothetical protein [Pedobacter cryoconitis]